MRLLTVTCTATLNENRRQKDIHFIFVLSTEKIVVKENIFFFHGSTALVGLDLEIVEVSRSHSDTPHSVGLLWTSDRPLRRDLYLTTHSSHKRQTSMPAAGFEPAIPACERLQTHALDRAATGIGKAK